MRRRITPTLARFRAAHAAMLAAARDLESALEAECGALRAAPVVPRQVRAIQEVVAGHFQISPALLVSVLRDSQVVTARHIAIRLCREITGLNNQEVGAAFNRSRGAVENALEVVSQRLSTERDFPALLAEVRAKAQSAG